jgi:hypothetical protein
MIEQRHGDWVVTNPMGSAVLARFQTEELAEAFLAGFAAGKDYGWDEAIDSDGVVLVDDEGNPTIKPSELRKMVEGNRRFLAEHSS